MPEETTALIGDIHDSAIDGKYEEVHKDSVVFVGQSHSNVHYLLRKVQRFLFLEYVKVDSVDYLSISLADVLNALLLTSHSMDCYLH